MLNFTTLKNRSARGKLTAIAWFVAGCLLTPTLAGAAEYYVAPTGSSTNDGSVSRPLDLATALSASSPARAGDTIWLRHGTYVGNFVSDLVGSPSAPIIVRQYPGERATIDANLLTPHDRADSRGRIPGTGFRGRPLETVRMVRRLHRLAHVCGSWRTTKFINMTFTTAAGFGFGISSRQ